MSIRLDAHLIKAIGFDSKKVFDEVVSMHPNVSFIVMEELKKLRLSTASSFDIFVTQVIEKLSDVDVQTMMKEAQSHLAAKEYAKVCFRKKNLESTINHNGANTSTGNNNQNVSIDRDKDLNNNSQLQRGLLREPHKEVEDYKKKYEDMKTKFEQSKRDYGVLKEKYDSLFSCFEKLKELFNRTQ